MACLQDGAIIEDLSEDAIDRILAFYQYTPPTCRKNDTKVEQLRRWLAYRMVQLLKIYLKTRSIVFLHSTNTLHRHAERTTRKLNNYADGLLTGWCNY